jgi:dTDP-4-dehydrorhamnose 3,5-epimerase
MNSAVRVDRICGLRVKVTDRIVRDRCQVNNSVKTLEVLGRYIADITGPLLISFRLWPEVASVVPTNIEPDDLVPSSLNDWDEYSAYVAAVSVDEHPHNSLLTVLDTGRYDSWAIQDRLEAESVSRPGAIYFSAVSGPAVTENRSVRIQPRPSPKERKVRNRACSPIWARVAKIATRRQSARSRSMDVTTVDIPGLLVFTPRPHLDQRGFFSRTFDAEIARRAGLDPCAFVQDSISRSLRGVIRGLHVRIGRGEGKLVRCSAGAIFDVVVDLRPGSATFGRWLSFDLNGTEQRSIYIPPGCAHGFQALTETADTAYRIDRAHDPSEDLTIAHDDPSLAIPWPADVTIMSDSDRAARPLYLLTDELSRIGARAATGPPL